jgi:hypothetical protein
MSSLGPKTRKRLKEALVKIIERKACVKPLTEGKARGGSGAVKNTNSSTKPKYGPPPAKPKKKPVWKEVKRMVPFCPVCGSELLKITNEDAKTLFTWECSKTDCGFCY